MTPREIAPGVFWLPLGRGFKSVNAYLVRAGSTCVLIDAGWKADAAALAQAAAAMQERDSAPTAILLTHVHPDHSGAARELAGRWGCRVWVHPRELPLALGEVDALWSGTGPLDRWLILPAMRSAGRRRMRELLARESLADVAETLEPGGEPPGLPGWRVLQTPGHTPGHVAFVRPADRVVVTGDALATVELNSPAGMIRRTKRVSTAPWITTWDWTTARASAAALAALDPEVLAGGHGDPLCGPDAREGLRRFLGRR